MGTNRIEAFSDGVIAMLAAELRSAQLLKSCSRWLE